MTAETMGMGRAGVGPVVEMCVWGEGGGVDRGLLAVKDHCV